MKPDATDGEEMTIRQLEDWLPLLEMFSDSHSVLQGAAGEDAMNVGDIIKIVRSHILCRAVTDLCCKRRLAVSETAPSIIEAAQNMADAVGAYDNQNLPIAHVRMMRERLLTALRVTPSATRAFEKNEPASAQEIIRNIERDLSLPVESDDDKNGEPSAYLVQFQEVRTDGGKKHVTMASLEPRAPAIMADWGDQDVESRALLKVTPLYATPSATLCPENNQPCDMECTGGWCRTLYGKPEYVNCSSTKEK